MNILNMAGKLVEMVRNCSEKANKRQAVVYISGPFALKTKTPAAFFFETGELRLSTVSPFGSRDLCRIPYDKIVDATVDTVEQFTLTRAVLVGIFAFGFKRKDKFLKLDYIDEVGTASSAVFAKGPLAECDHIRGLILTAKREFLKSRVGV